MVTRATVLQEMRQMRFEESYGRRQRRRMLSKILRMEQEKRHHMSDLQKFTRMGVYVSKSIHSQEQRDTEPAHRSNHSDEIE